MRFVLRKKITMPDAQLPRSHALGVLLEEGVRYERAGVVSRAQESFQEITHRAEQDPAAAAEAWWRLANLHRLHSAWDNAIDAARRSIELSQEFHLPDTEADALNIQGAVWMNCGDFEQARVLFRRSLECARDPAIRGKALQNLGALAAEDRSFDEAEQLFTESRDAYTQAGDARGEACSLLNIGRLKTERGFAREARSILEAAAAGARISGDLEMHAAALLNLGIALNDLGEVSEAEERITTAYGQFTIADIPLQRVRCLMQLATLAATRNEPTAARVCLSHAREVATLSGLPREIRLIEDQLNALPSII
ncbi:MAG: tetratricopeptide repeat protein [bacterium]